MYKKNDDGTYTDPITNKIYQSTDTVSNGGFMIDTVKGIHRKDETVYVNGEPYSTGGMAEELYKKTNGKGIFPANFDNNYQVKKKDEINRERVFMISMIDETGSKTNINTRYYHSNYATEEKPLAGNSGDFYDYIPGHNSGFTQAYVEDFNKFIDIYRNDYTYFRGYNYSTFGSNKTNWPGGASSETIYKKNDQDRITY